MEGGEQSRGEVVRVDAGREFAVGMQGSQSIADDRCPLIEPGCDEGSGLGVVLGELTTERTKCAAALSWVCLTPVTTMFRQASIPFALPSACRLFLTMVSAW